MFKVNKWMLMGLAATVIFASVPVSEVLADHDHDEKHHERWEHKSKGDCKQDDKKKQKNSKAWKDHDYRKVPDYTPNVQFDAADVVDGKTLTLVFSEGIRVDAVVKVKNGQLLIPAQPVLKAFQIPYVLYPNGTILEGFANGKQFIFHANKKVMYLDGQKKSMTFPAFKTSGQFYVPLKDMAEVLGYSVITKQENNTLTFSR